MRPLVVAHHVPKTSGSALRVALKQNLGSERVYWHLVDGNINEDLGALRDMGERLAVIGGHFGFDAAEGFEFDRPLIRVSMVREPIELLFSAINFVRKRPEHPQHTDITPDAAEFLETDLFRRFSRTQCVTMTSKQTAVKAIDRLHSNAYIVTTSENVETLVRRVLDLFDQEMTVPLGWVNAGSGDHSWFDLEKARGLFEPGVKEDRLLYQYVIDNCNGWLDTTG